ncbi:MAG: lytic transglycosylase domain-containing protein [Syntrophorhabdales bacterium]
MKKRPKTLLIVVPLLLLTAALLAAATMKHAFAKEGEEKNAVIEKIVAHLKGKDIHVGEDRLKAVVNTVYDESLQRDIDYRLALAVIKVESNFRHDVVSNKGARGLFQIKPSLAKYIAKDAGVVWNGADCLQEPDKNIKLGIYHLSRLVEDFQSLPTALNAYNVGTSKVKARQAGKMKATTTAFAKRVLKEYRKNIALLPETDGSR